MRATIVNGQVLLRDNEPTGNLPGKLVRRRQALHACPEGRRADGLTGGVGSSAPRFASGRDERCRADGSALIPSLDFAAPHHHIRASPLPCGLTKVSRDRATRPLILTALHPETIPQKRAVPAARGNGPKAALHTRARKARSAAKRTLFPVSNVSFADLGLAEPLLRALEAAKYTVPTPIQARTIPGAAAGPRRAGHRPDRHRQDRGLRAARAAAPLRLPRARPAQEPARAGAGADPRARRPDRAAASTPTAAASACASAPSSAAWAMAARSRP